MKTLHIAESILFYPITLEGRRGTTDELATILFYLVLFSAALVELAKSISVHSLVLSSHDDDDDAHCGVSRAKYWVSVDCDTTQERKVVSLTSIADCKSQ